MADSDYLTLTTFVPGTKAKADEVNANFTALKNAVNQKASLSGDSSQVFSVANASKNEHAVNKSQLDDLSDYLSEKFNKSDTKFCVKSGNVSNGNGNLFSYSVLRLTPLIAGTYDNLVISDYTGKQTTISSMPNTLDLTGNSDGTYNIFITPTGTLYILNNKIYKQAARPSMVVNDIWLNTSTEPFKCIKYSGSSDIEFLDVALGKVTIKNSAITSVETFPFNQNDYKVNTQTTLKSGSNLSSSIVSMCSPDHLNGVSKTAGITYTAESAGVLQFGAYGNSNQTTLTLNGTSYQAMGATGAAVYVTLQFAIAKGDTYSLNSNANNIIFYPLKSI